MLCSNWVRHFVKNTCNLFAAPSAPRRRKRSCQLSVEALESRWLPSANAVLEGPVLFVYTDDTPTAVHVTHEAPSVTRVSWYSSTGSDSRAFPDMFFTSIQIYMGTSDDDVYLNSLPAGRPTTVNGRGGLDFIYVGNGDTSGVLSSVNLVNGQGFNYLFVNDVVGSPLGGRQVVHDTFTDANNESWGVIRGMIPGGDIVYKNADTPTVDVQTGYTGAFVSVLRTQVPLTLFGNASPDNLDRVSIGHDGTVQDIQKTVTVRGSYQRTVLWMNDFNDSVPRRVTLDDLVSRPTGTGRIVNLAPGEIHFDYSAVRLLDIVTKPGSVVDVRATGTATGIAGSSFVNVGDGGRLLKIQGNLYVTALPDRPTVVNVDDSADPVYHPDVLLGQGGDNRVLLENLAPALIRIYGTPSVTFPYLRVRTGPGGVGVTARSFSVPTSLMTSGPADTVTVSNNGVADLNASLFLASEQGSVALVVDDSNRPATQPRSVTHDTFEAGDGTYGSIRGLTNSGEIAYRVDRVPTVRLRGGLGDDTFYDLGMGANGLTIETGGGNDAVLVGLTNAGLDSIRGTLTVDGGSGFNILLLDDSANPADQTFTVTATTVTRSGLSPLTYRNFNSLQISAGRGNDTVAFKGTVPGLTVYADGGDGGANTLVGPDAAAWNIRFADDGSLTSAALGGPVYFSRFGSLEGGSGNDMFAFGPDGSLSGTIDGGGGRNRLDYRARADAVKVILPLGKATATAGIAHIQDVYGSQGDNLLVGDDQPNELRGGAGRNILIGGGGADVLFGRGQDILIGGRTDYDRNESALTALWTEWRRTDRVKRLWKEGRHRVLNHKTAHDDGAADQLTGGSGLTWFFAGKDDVLFGVGKDDIITQTSGK